MDKIKVLLVEKKSEDRGQISDILSKVNYINLLGEADNLEEVNYLIQDNYPDVIIIGANLDIERHSLAESISNEHEDIAIIMIENILKEDTMYKALFSGAKDVIISPFTSSKLVDSIYRAAQMVKKQNSSNRDTPIRQKAGRNRAKVITIFSTKGGVGKTFISTNLAVALAKNTDKNVCLVDLDLDFGNTVLALNIVPRYTILDIVDDIRNINQDIIESYLIPHESGIKVLAANAKPQINEFVNADHIDIILNALQGAFDYVVVDMPARFYEPVNPAFQAADILLMITTPEISAVRNIKASIQTLYDLNFSKSKLKIVLNKADSSGYINSKDVENTLNQGLYGTIAADYKLAMISLNNGVPVTISKPRSSISKSINNLAQKIQAEFKDNGIR